jgi:hypothetical protein
LVADSDCGSVSASSVSTQAWVNIAFTALSKVNGVSLCNKCGASNDQQAFYADPPALLCFETGGQSHPSVLLSAIINVPGDQLANKYVLQGVIYLEDYHFKTRLLGLDQQVWQHDGHSNSGLPMFDEDATSAKSLSSDHFASMISSLTTADAHMYIYCLEEI